jgi:mono/diheme cytochrome c family protein
MKIAVIVAAALALVAGGMVVSTLSYGFSTHDEPTKVERALARAARRLSVPSELRAAKNPVAASPAVFAEARAHFADHCASCHGNDGKGETTLGQHLYPRAPDMTLAETQQLSDGELFATIENGIRLTGMPGWGDGSAQSGYGSWSLVHFIRHLPELTAEELAEMEAKNPKAPEEWEQLQAEREFLAGGAGEPAAAHDESMPHNH